MRISDWSSDVCSSDLLARTLGIPFDIAAAADVIAAGAVRRIDLGVANVEPFFNVLSVGLSAEVVREHEGESDRKRQLGILNYPLSAWTALRRHRPFRAVLVVDGATLRCRCTRSEEHTSELQSLMRISYAVFGLKKKINEKK